MLGCGKISANLAKKLYSKTISYNGKIYPGPGRAEILSVVYFCQVADPSGYVPSVKVSELKKVLRCTERNIYYVLHSLEQKGIIAFEGNQSWQGFRNIRVLDNDFSKITNYGPSTRYINAFYPCFDLSNSQNIFDLTITSRYALKTMLLILLNMDPKWGLRISCDEIAKRIGLEDRSLVASYLKELTFFFGDFYKIWKDPVHRLKYGLIVIKRNCFLIPDSPSEMQMTYYKRHWKLMFDQNSIHSESIGSLMDCINYLFKSIYHILEEKLNLLAIEEAIINSLILQGGNVNLVTVRHAFYAASPP